MKRMNNMARIFEEIMGLPTNKNIFMEKGEFIEKDNGLFHDLTSFMFWSDEATSFPIDILRQTRIYKNGKLVDKEEINYPKITRNILEKAIKKDEFETQMNRVKNEVEPLYDKITLACIKKIEKIKNITNVSTIQLIKSEEAKIWDQGIRFQGIQYVFQVDGEESLDYIVSFKGPNIHSIEGVIQIDKVIKKISFHINDSERNNWIKEKLLEISPIRLLHLL
jgi:hypothetical protein